MKFSPILPAFALALAMTACGPANDVEVGPYTVSVIGQNVYLHCASTGLGTVFLGMINPKELSAGLGLPATRVPLFAQTVGHVK